MSFVQKVKDNWVTHGFFPLVIVVAAMLIKLCSNEDSDTDNSLEITDSATGVYLAPDSHNSGPVAGRDMTVNYYVDTSALRRMVPLDSKDCRNITHDSLQEELIEVYRYVRISAFKTAEAQAQCLKMKNISLTALDTAIVLMGLRDYKTALIHLDYAIRGAWEDSTVLYKSYFNVALCLGFLGDFLPAPIYFDSSLMFNPNNPDAWAFKGTAQAIAGDLASSLESYNSALSITSDSSPILADRGTTFLRFGDTARALNDFSLSVDMDSTNTLALFNRGGIHSMRGEYALAREDFRRVVDIDNTDYASWVRLADNLRLMGLVVDAVTATERAMSIDSSRADAWLVKSRTLSGNGELHRAIVTLQDAINSGVQTKEIWYSLGVVLFDNRSIRESIKCYDSAISLYPSFPDALFNKGVAFERLGNLTGAIEMYELVLGYEPKYAKAWWNLATDKCIIGLQPISELVYDSAVYYDSNYVTQIPQALSEIRRIRAGR